MSYQKPTCYICAVTLTTSNAPAHQYWSMPLCLACAARWCGMMECPDPQIEPSEVVEKEFTFDLESFDPTFKYPGPDGGF